MAKAKSKVILSKETRDELAKASKSISLIPVLREKLLTYIGDRIEEDTVNELLKKPEMIIKMDEDLILSYVGGLYKTTLTEKLNPVNVFINNKEIKSQVKKEMYNPEFKEEFISRYNESTQRVFRVVFKKTAILERAYNKDLYDFTLEEFQDVLKSMQAKTIRSLQSTVTKFKQYIAFALDKGVSSENANYAEMFSSASRLEQFMSKKAEDIVFSRQEIMSMAMSADNAQDGAIIAVLFDGVNNKNQFSEIINLKKSDFDPQNNQLKISNEDNCRVINLSTETCILVKQAIDNDEYISIQGDDYRKYHLYNSEYIFRSVRNNEQVSWRNVTERIARIAKANDEEMSATNIVYSGQLHFLKQSLSETDMETALKDTLINFGLPVNSSSVHTLKKRYEKFGKKL